LSRSKEGTYSSERKTNNSLPSKLTLKTETEIENESWRTLFLSFYMISVLLFSRIPTLRESNYWGKKQKKKAITGIKTKKRDFIA
jgi:hypothetical protein